MEAAREVIVIDVILDRGAIGRHVYELSESEQAHTHARALAKGHGPTSVSLRVAGMTADGYLIEAP